MKNFDSFEAALAEFEESGGAMNFCDAHLPGEQKIWQVGTLEEIDEATNDDVTPRYATEHALREGGKPEAEIAILLEDWDDDKEEPEPMHIVICSNPEVVQNALFSNVQPSELARAAAESWIDAAIDGVKNWLWTGPHKSEKTDYTVSHLFHDWNGGRYYGRGLIHIKSGVPYTSGDEKAIESIFQKAVESAEGTIEKLRPNYES